MGRAGGVLADGADPVTPHVRGDPNLHANKVFANEPVHFVVTGTGSDLFARVSPAIEKGEECGKQALDHPKGEQR